MAEGVAIGRVKLRRGQPHPRTADGEREDALQDLCRSCALPRSWPADDLSGHRQNLSSGGAVAVDSTTIGRCHWALRERCS